MTTTICLVRHGQTNWNNLGLIQGKTDNALNEVGIKQAQTVSLYLKDNDNQWDVLFSSPLKRAYETGLIIKQTLNLDFPIIKDEQFIERDFGELEGTKLTKEIYDLIFQEKTKGLEKQKDLEKRAINALMYLGKKYPGKRILVTTHSQFIKGALASLDKDFVFTTLLHNTSLNYFKIEDDKISIIKYNCHPY